MKLKQLQVTIAGCEDRMFNLLLSNYCNLLMWYLKDTIVLRRTKKLNIVVNNKIEDISFSEGIKTFNYISSLAINYETYDILSLSCQEQLKAISKIIKYSLTELNSIERFELEVVEKVLNNIENMGYIFRIPITEKRNRRKIIGHSIKEFDLIQNKISLIHKFSRDDGTFIEHRLFEANLQDSYSNYLFTNSKWINADKFCTSNITKEIQFISDINGLTNSIEIQSLKNELETLRNEIQLIGYGNRQIGTWQEEQKLELKRIGI